MSASSTVGGQALAANRVGAAGVAGFALTAAAPMLVVGGVITTAIAVTGTTAIGATLILLATVLGVWCVGYLTLARRVPNAGSLYTYVAHGFGPTPGIAAGMVQLLAYSMMQISLYGIGGAQAQAILGDLTGLDAPWWFWALAAWTIVAFLGTRGVGVSSRLLAIAVAAEFLIILLASTILLTHPAHGITLEALDPTQLDTSTLGVGLAIAVTAYIGIEAAPVYSEECRDPRRTMLAASVAALLLMVVPYVLAAWAMVVGVGGDQIVATTIHLGPDTLLLPASQHWGGQSLVNAGHLLLLTSIAAGMLAYHNSVSRCAFALGRERVLPAILGRTSPRTCSPIGASLAQSATGLAAIVTFAALDLDPMTQVFYTLGTTGALGVFTLMVAASAAVVAVFRADRRGESPWATTILPTASTLTMGGCVLSIVDNYPSLIGVSAASPARWLPALFLVVAACGVAHALWLRAHRPLVLDRVGLGIDAIDVVPPPTATSAH